MTGATGHTMKYLAETIDRFLNGDAKGEIAGERKIGFALLVFPFDGPEGQSTNYISNAERGEMLVVLKEVIARWEGQPEQKGRA